MNVHQVCTHMNIIFLDTLSSNNIGSQEYSYHVYHILKEY